MSDSTTFQAIGGVVMLVGVWIFVTDQRAGENSAKAGPLELKVSTPTIVFFLVGACLFCFPFTQWFHQPMKLEPPTSASDIRAGDLDVGEKNPAVENGHDVSSTDTAAGTKNAERWID